MRISGQNNHPSVERPQTTAVQPQAGGAGKSGDARATHAQGGVGTVEVSKTSQRLAMARAPETPDAERIARMRAAIAAGSLSIDSGAIADAMLREER
jgi:flagellar biosynthesis anti-sigma factor FlgM